MKTIKIIDLLNKKANKEQMPNKIKQYNKIFIWNDTIKEYENAEDNEDLMFCNMFLHRCLDDEVEILDKYYIRAFMNDEVEIIEEETKVEQRFTGCEWFADSKEVMSMDYSPERLKEEK